MIKSLVDSLPNRGLEVVTVVVDGKTTFLAGAVLVYGKTILKLSFFHLTKTRSMLTKTIRKLCDVDQI